MLQSLTRSLRTLQPSSAVAESLLNLEQIKELISNRSRITIRALNSHQVFQSIILSIDTVNKTLLIDELFPQPVNEFNSNQSICCEFTNAGNSTTFSSTTIANTHVAGLPALIINYPQSIEQQQRRNNYRQNVSDQQPVSAKISANHGLTLSGHVKNISHSGLGINLHGNYTDAIEAGEVMNNCTIRIDRTNTFDCQLTVRNKHYRNSPYRHTELGLEITEITEKHSHLLSNYVSQQQRVQCKLNADKRLYNG